jgi:hypothetical protein
MKRSLAYLFAIALGTALAAQQPWARLTSEINTESQSFMVLLQTSSDAVPVALQCDLVIPAAVTVNLTDIQPSSAASAAGKNLNCASKASGAAVRYTCILWGGEGQIPNGPVFSVGYSFPASRNPLPRPPVRVAIQKAIVVAGNSTPIPVPDTEVILSAR